LYDPAENEEARMDRAKAVTLFLLRVVSGFLFFHHGGQKMLGWFGGIPPNGAAAPLWSQAGIGGFLEFFGGLLILIGLFTRPVAFILAGEMAVAYFQFHQPGGLLPIQNHGEGAALYCFIFLLFATWGPGEWSVDAALARRRAVAVPARA
jgi:putative oxidoreductase